MRIAFDVKGTIDGPKGKFVLGLFKFLQDLGHECVVWSNSYGYAVDAVMTHALNAEAMPKKGKGDFGYEDKASHFDIAIEDDTSQTWLAAKRFIWVHELPGAMGGIKKLAEDIHSGHFKVDQEADTVRDQG